MGDERRGVAARARPLAELKRQQRIGRLIGRQMGRDVKDPHSLQYACRNSANVAGTAPSWVRAKSKKRSRRSQKAASSASLVLYGLPPTMASLEWNSKLSTGSPASARSRASEIMSSSGEYDGRSQRTRAMP